MARVLSKKQLDILVECVKKQGRKRLGPTFCDDYLISDPDLENELDDKKALQIITNRYCDFNDPWSGSH